MNSTLISKVEKARRYTGEPERIKFNALSVRFRGDNDTHHVAFNTDTWQCSCHSFEVFQACSHVMTLQRVLHEMLPERAQTSIYEHFGAAPLA